jgi:endoglucanase
MKKLLLYATGALLGLSSTHIAGAQTFQTGFESGETQPTWSNSVNSSSNVGGYCCGLSQMESGTRGEAGYHSGSALMYSGSDNSSSGSYSYNRVFSVNIPVSSSTQLSYFIYPQSVHASNSKFVAVDLWCSDGSNLRDSGAVDQNGTRVHPAWQGPRLANDAWNEVRSDIGRWLNGKTITTIAVAYDQPGSTGVFRGYVDFLRIGPATLGYGTARAGVNLAGGEFSHNALPGIYDQNYTYPTAQEMDYYKSRGRMIIRLPFLWERLQSSLNGSLVESEMQRIDGVLNNARSRGMQVILDCHNYGRYKIGGTNEQILGSSQVPASAFGDFWNRIAQRYKNHAGVYGYGLMNEPHDMNDNARWPNAAQNAVNSIRNTGDMKYIYVAGDHWSGAHSWRNTSNENLNIFDAQNRIIYEAHQYFDNDSSGTYDQSYDGEGAYPNIGVDRVTPFIQWLQAKGKKGFIGEYGVPGNDSRWNTVMQNFLNHLNANGISSTYWAGGPWWGDYPLSIEPTNNFSTDKPQMNVLKNYNG